MGWFWEWAYTAGTEPSESIRQYCKKIWLFLGYAFAHICIGAANVLVLAYSMTTNDLHGFFCTIGWQFFVSEAILVICYTYCNPVYPEHRRVVHMFLNILGLIFVCSGSVLILYIAGIKKTLASIHGLVGLIAFLCTIFISLAGPFAGMKYDWPKAIHGLMALPTYITAAVSLVTGILTLKFKSFVGGFSVILMMLVLIAFYIAFISIVALIKICCTCKKVCKQKTNTRQQTRR